MTKLEIVLRLLESLNRGDTGGAYDRVNYALAQYDKLVNAGVIKEDKE